MNIIVNGEEREVEEGSSISSLIKSFSLKQERLIVQKDDEIIKKEKLNSILLTEGSKIELLSIVGGG